MANILALDTSSDHCSVALGENGRFTFEGELAVRKHAKIILPMVQAVLDRQSLTLAQLDAIAFGCGPGSFTGLRIATGVVQGLAYGLGCPVIAISNLSALAVQCYRQQGFQKPGFQKPSFQKQSFDKQGSALVLVVLDARMDEVYWSLCQVFETEGEVRVQSLTGERVGPPESVFIPESVAGAKLFGIGSGFALLERFPVAVQSAVAQFDVEARPHALAICELAEQALRNGQTVAPAAAAPVYLRDDIGWKKLPGRD